MKILITGATGFLGSELSKKFLENGHHLIVMTRNIAKASQKLNYPHIQFCTVFEQIDLNEKIDIIINLAGEPIADKKWTEQQKQEIINSRVNITKELCFFLKKIKKKPQLVINGSAIGWYGFQHDNDLTEESSYQECFSHQLCAAWESEARKIEKLNIPLAIIRTGIVLGAKGGLLKKVLPIFNMNLGGQLGDGSQYMSWIHIDDWLKAVMFIIEKKLSGIFNLTAPHPVTNEEFTNELAVNLSKWAFLNIPSWLLKRIYQDLADELLLGSGKILPGQLQKNDFKFSYEFLDQALKDILKSEI